MAQSRYQHQIRYSKIGERGQEKISGASVAIVGLGALGSHIAETMTRMGVGKLTLIDRDFVEISNLARQTLYCEADAANSLPKALAAKIRLSKINSTIQISEKVADLNSQNYRALFSGADLIMDGTDNFLTRFIINDFSVKQSTPWIHAGVLGSYGQVMTIVKGGACYQCVVPDVPESGSYGTCESDGVIAPAVATIAALATASAIESIVQPTIETASSITSFDISKPKLTHGLLKPRSSCICCQGHQFNFLAGKNALNAYSLCGRNAVHVRGKRAFNLDSIRNINCDSKTISSNEYLWRFEKNSFDITLFADGRAIIKGVSDMGRAKTIYTELTGG